jgi:hypothetical protein
MIMLHKKDDPIELENWRPICLANTLYKLWTSCVTKVLSDYAEEHNILQDSQQGFRRVRNTRKQINRLLTVIEDARLEHNELHVMYIDFKNAFGSLDHTRLKQTMEYLGFTDDVIRIVGGIYSGDDEGPKMLTTIISAFGSTDPIEVKRGSVQGDSMSPFLFLVYMEPLLRWLSAGNKGYTHTAGSGKDVSTNAMAYADDLAITTSNVKDMEIQLQKVQLYSQWSDLWINPTKSAITGIYTNNSQHQYAKLLVLDPQGNTTPMTYLTEDEPYKYLGIDITLTLNWKHHKQRT